MWLGSAAALGSALGFALNVALAGAVYDAGGNIHAVNLVRPATFLLCLWVWLKAAGHPIGLPTRPRNRSLLLGLLLFIEIYTLLGAIHFIEVALAVLVLYTYPLMVAVFGWATGREKLTADVVLAMLAALAGLAMALQVSGNGLDGRGLALSAAAAVTLGALVITSDRVMEGQDNRVVMFHMTLTVAVIMVLLSVAGLPLVWPQGVLGWLALAGTAVFFVIGTFLLFTAVSMVGPLRTAIIDTSAPVWAMLFGYLLLQQTLSPTQLLGAGLVIVSIVVVQIGQHEKQ